MFGDLVNPNKLVLYGTETLNLQNYKERIHIMEGRLIAFVIWVIIGVLFILGAMLISIAAMVAYVVGIEPKCRKKK